MYGDVGHGAVLLFFSILLCLFGKGMPALKSAYEARYLLLLSTFFATYCGFIYNDFMSLPLNLFESCWDLSKGGKAVRTDPNCVYPFGIDHGWYGASNELLQFNSIKMKLAVILGVLQMTLGLLLKAFNGYYNKDWKDLLNACLP